MDGEGVVVRSRCEGANTIGMQGSAYKDACTLEIPVQAVCELSTFQTSNEEASAHGWSLVEGVKRKLRSRAQGGWCQC